MKKYSYRRAWGKIRSINLKIGFVLSLAFVFFAFQWNVDESPPKEHNIPDIEETHVDASVPNYVEKKLIPPVTKKVEVHKKEILDLFEVKTTEEVEIDDTDFIDSDPEDVVDFSPVEIEGSAGGAPIVEIEIKEPEDDPTTFFASQMPVFGECFELGEEEERRLCSDNTLREYVSKNLKYPQYAREVGMQGTVVAQFTIGKDGKIKDVKIVREVGGGTSEEVLRVIESMPLWTPGKQNFRPVNVRITLPVKFALN